MKCSIIKDVVLCERKSEKIGNCYYVESCLKRMQNANQNSYYNAQAKLYVKYQAYVEENSVSTQFFNTS